MLRSDRAGPGRAGPRDTSFVLYVEGPRDRDILRTWAQRLSPRFSRRMAESSVILGGRQPARAVEHFRGLGGASAGARAFCVLDRDHGGHEHLDGPSAEPGLEFYTWRRRHIESYLLVPAAIRRALRLDRHDPRVDRLFREHLPSLDDEQAMAEVDAKRLLDGRGPLARGLGREIVPGRVARAMREAELHGDVTELFARLNEGMGLRVPESCVVERG